MTRAGKTRFGTLLLLAALVLAVGPAQAESKQPADAGGAVFIFDEPADVVVWNRTIATLRVGVKDVTAEERARRAVKRLLAIPSTTEEHRVAAQPASLGPYVGAFVTVDGEQVIGLVHEDAPEDQSFEEFTAEVVANVEAWLELRAQQQRWPILLRGLGLAAAATAIFGVLLLVLRRIDAFWVSRRSRDASTTGQKSRWMIGDVDVRPYLIAVEIGLVRIAVRLSVLFFGYLWLTFVLNQFPYTRIWSTQLSDLLLGLLGRSGLAVVRALPDVATVGLIYLITRLLVRVITAFFASAEVGALQSTWLEPETARATRRLVVALTWIFALIIAYPYIPGSGTEAFKGVSVFLGLMVSLGSAGMVGQVIGGLVVVYTRAFQRGDFVKVGEHEGVVREIGVLSTKFVTPRQEEVTIPNAVLLGATVVNFSRLTRDDGATVSTTVTIGYDTPWRQVEGILLTAAERTPGVRKTPPPRVLQRALSDFYPEYVLLVNIDRPEKRYRVLSELHGHIQDVFHEHGVQIMSPNFEAQPEQPVLPARDSWFAPPSRRKPRDEDGTP